jgi:hypothetical protein
MMARTQITLDPKTHRRARERAVQMGISLAEYMRRLVARDLGETPTIADPAAVFNLGDSGGSDVAKEKDAMIGAATAGGRRRRRSKR